MAEPSPEKEIEGAYVVPDGWVWCILGEVCEINPKSTNLSDFDQSLPTTFVPMTAVDQIEGTIKTSEILPLGKARKGHTQFIENDVIFARITPCMENGKAAIAKNLENSLGFGSTEFHVIRPPDEILPEYIFYFVRQESFRNKASAHFTSTVGQMRVPKAFMLAASFPLPPLPEQHRIVTKLEALLAQVNRSKDHLAKVPLLIKRFRQSVLAAACSGRQTEDWRREHPDVEPASELLNRIRGERIRRYDEECRKAEIEDRRKPKKPKNLEPQALDTEGLPELPEGWLWAKLGDVNETTSGGTPKRTNKDYYGGDIPWLKSGELEDNVITKAEETITDLGLKKSSAKIFPTGTLLIALYGATVGKTGKLAIESATNQAICGIFNDDQVFYDQYLWHYLISFRNILIEKSFGGAQPNISQGIIQNLNVPLPPLAEQRVIVEQVETLFHFADEVEQHVAAATAHTNHLTQSILARAFRGELVPQDPRDEHASVLLERIKQERAKNEMEKKTGKRKTKTLLNYC